ncbi:MAG: DMT family transporter [Bacteroidales bacterium]|nr:DMT family transporter [Bacteroidales bacterium]
MIHSNRTKAHMAIIGANILFGINYAIAKGVMPIHLKPGGFTLLRVITALSLFYALSRLSQRNEKIDRSDYFRFVLAGLMGVSLNQMLFLFGLNLSSPIDSSIISTLNPAMVMLIAFMAIGEKIGVKKIIGLAIGASGALMLIFGKGELGFGSDHFVGNIMLFLNTLFYAGYLVIVKPLTEKYSAVTVMRGVFTVGFFAVLPFGAKDLATTAWGSIPAPIYGAILFVLLGPTFLAYLLNSWGLRHVQTSTVSIYIYSQPVIATAFAAMLGQDTLDAQKIIAALLVFTGVYLVSSKKLKPNRATK